MGQLRAIVKAGRADIGFAHDADGERLGIVTEAGRYFRKKRRSPGAESSMRRGAPARSSRNVSTSSAIEVIAARHGASVIRTRSASFYLRSQIENRAVIGGEGSRRRHHPARTTHA